MKIILASGSAWRNKLLEWLEIPFEVVVSDVDESIIDEKKPNLLVEKLAEMKAVRVFDQLSLDGNGDELLVLGGDTVIVVDEKPVGDVKILGKPADDKEAWKTLQQLRGREHEVWSGVCLMSNNERKLLSEKTVVHFHDYSDDELETFMQTNEWVGKAGAYQIMGEISRFVEKIDGSFTNIIGLPLVTIAGLLEENGVEIEVDVRQVIRDNTGYDS